MMDEVIKLERRQNEKVYFWEARKSAICNPQTIREEEEEEEEASRQMFAICERLNDFSDDLAASSSLALISG